MVGSVFGEVYNCVSKDMQNIPKNDYGGILKVTGGGINCLLHQFPQNRKLKQNWANLLCMSLAQMHVAVMLRKAIGGTFFPRISEVC